MHALKHPFPPFLRRPASFRDLTQLFSLTLGLGLSWALKVPPNHILIFTLLSAPDAALTALPERQEPHLLLWIHSQSQQKPAAGWLREADPDGYKEVVCPASLLSQVHT